MTEPTLAQRLRAFAHPTFDPLMFEAASLIDAQAAQIDALRAIERWCGGWGDA